MKIEKVLAVGLCIVLFLILAIGGIYWIGGNVSVCPVCDWWDIYCHLSNATCRLFEGTLQTALMIIFVVILALFMVLFLYGVISRMFGLEQKTGMNFVIRFIKAIGGIVKDAAGFFKL